MPEWFAQLLLGALLTVIGAIVLRIDRKLDRMDERQSKTERDCVTWPELEKITLRVNEHDRRLTIVETTCEQRHGK